MALIDTKNLQILELLDEDVRAGSKKIAKELGLSRQVVDYRIRTMEDKKIILQYRMLANLPKLGFVYHRVHIKFKHITKSRKKEILYYLISKKRTVWVVTCDGIHDLMVGFASTTFKEFRTMLYDFVSTFTENIAHYGFVHMIDIVVPARDFSGKKKTRGLRGHIVDDSKTIHFDALDKKIINRLAKQGRITAVELAHNLDVPVQKIQYRIREILRKKALFSNVQYRYDLFGFELYKVLFYLKNPSIKRINELKKFAQAYPRVWNTQESLGEWQFELDIESKGHEDYYKIVDTIQEKFSDIITNYSTLYVREEHKFLFAIFDE